MGLTREGRKINRCKTAWFSVSRNSKKNATSCITYVPFRHGTTPMYTSIEPENTNKYDLSNVFLKCLQLHNLSFHSLTLLR